MKTSSYALQCAVHVALLSIVPCIAEARTLTWSGFGDTDLWSDSDNWSPAFVPTDGDVLVFDGTVLNQSNDNDLANLRVASIRFAGPGNFSISGNPIQVDTDIVANNTSGFGRVLMNLTFTSGGGTLYTLSTGQLEIRGAITLANNQQLIAYAFTTNITLSGAIVGNGDLLKLGNGTLYLTGNPANTYNGLTLIRQGAVHLAKPSAAPAISPNVFIGDTGNGSSLHDDLGGQYPPAMSMFIGDRGHWGITNGATVTNLTIYSPGGIRGTGLLTLGCDVEIYHGDDTYVTQSGIGCPIFLGSQTRTFNFNIGPVLGIVNFRIDGPIIGLGPGPGSPGIILRGFAETYFLGPNLYNGPTIIESGSLQVRDSYGLGGAGAGAETWVEGGDLIFYGFPAMSVAEPIFMTGGDLEFYGTVTLTGGLVLSNNCTMHGWGNDYLLDINGAISGPDDFTVSGGVVRLSGSSPNTFGDNPFSRVIVQPNSFSGPPVATLELAKPGTAAVPVPVTIAAITTNIAILRQLQDGGVADVTIGHNGQWQLNGRSVTPTTLKFIGDGYVDSQGGLLQFTNPNTNQLLVVPGSPANYTAQILGLLSCAATTNHFYIESNLTLNIAAQISGGHIRKQGAGTLTFSGSTANTYSGGTLVAAGTLQLAKNSNLIAAPGSLTIGPATISSPATVRCYNTGMIPSGGTVTVNANALLDLNGYNQTLAQLNLNDGGDAQTATGTLGFPAGGNINIGTLNSTSPGLQNSSSISGRIALPALDYLNFNVSGYGQTPLSPDPELVVSAVISGGGNLIKNGFGAMRLSGANTFNDSPPFASGDLIINAGTVIAAANGALGGTAGWTWVQGGGRLSLINDITVTGETLYLNSTNAIVLDNPGGNNTWTGPVILARDSGISVNQDWSLFLYGAVSGSSANDLTKVGLGALIFGGTPANTYSGETFINAGELHLAKPFVVAAVPGALSIGNAAGAIATVRSYQSYQVIGNIFVNRNGTLDLNGFEENVDHLYLANGGDVHTGAGYLYLKTAGSLTVTPGNDNNPSTISGNVEILPGTFPFNIHAAPNSTNQPDLDVPARISSSGTITLQKNGGGRLRFSGNNTYVGQTYINGGTLQVDGAQPQSPVTLDHDTALRGSGIVGHITFNGGNLTLAPGNSPGVLTCSNFYASGGEGKLEIELTGLNPGPAYDQLNVRGAVDLIGLTLSPSLNFASAPNDHFTIINNDGSDSVIGTFTGLPQNKKFYIGGELFQISYTGGSGNDVVLNRLVTPPPPILKIEPVNLSSVRLLWPTNDPVFRLQHSTNLIGTNWFATIPAPTLIGTNHVVTNAVTETRRFYRLITP